MQFSKLKVALIALTGALSMTVNANTNDLTKFKNSFDKGQDLLQGDQRLACEAILCLSQGMTSGECRNSMKRYYSIKHKKAHRTARARANFLKLCPKDNGNVDKEKLSKIGLDFSKD